jgi:hypothetical protein
MTNIAPRPPGWMMRSAASTGVSALPAAKVEPCRDLGSSLPGWAMVALALYWSVVALNRRIARNPVRSCPSQDAAFFWNQLTDQLD